MTFTGSELIELERQRQILEEGWTPQHDDEQRHAYLSRAALSYGEAAVEQVVSAERGAPVRTTDLYTRTDWPWDDEWWKPSDDPIRNLVKAGALLAAEIDRLQRAETHNLAVCGNCARTRPSGGAP